MHEDVKTFGILNEMSYQMYHNHCATVVLDHTNVSVRHPNHVKSRVNYIYIDVKGFTGISRYTKSIWGHD